MDEQGLLKQIGSDMTDLKMIKIFTTQGKDFTAEDLLNMSLPFGCVITVQKIVKNGFTHGQVTYSNSDDAFKAMMKLNSTTDFVVIRQKLREVRDPTEKERSGSPSDQVPSLPHSRFSDMPQQRPPAPMTTLNPAPYSQGVSLKIQNLPKRANKRYQVFSLLPPWTTIAKIERKMAYVTCPDVSTAFQVMDLLTDPYSTGFQELHVSFASQAAVRTACRGPSHYQCQV